jgi:hypothetical protein
MLFQAGRAPINHCIIVTAMLMLDTLGVGRWALGVGRWALGVGRSALGVGRWALGVGRWAFGVRPSFGVGRSMLDFRYLPRLTTYRRIGSVKELAKLAATVAE